MAFNVACVLRGFVPLSHLISMYDSLQIIFRNLEPVASVAPKVSLADEFQVARERLGHTFNMACRAQSYPIPVFR